MRKFEDFAKDSEQDAEDFEEYPAKVTLSRNGTLFVGFTHDHIDVQLVKRVIFQLSLSRIEFAPLSLSSAYLYEDQIKQQFSASKVVVLHGVRRSSVVAEFSQMPSLRYIDFHDIPYLS